ncbi:MAG: FMN-binding glutamate synthase family protein [Cytophagaceae bacterium]|nr:FMN-binding glutamate synthase family protein [Cytophagaceae bacterium]MBL0302538.1 FMN-binding glutamate synthase family protein [Cytophagaceae bacterium]MBL0325366.1 FMN-binding glutamate synthase family protein [Cytophagaceae bacterium]
MRRLFIYISSALIITTLLLAIFMDRNWYVIFVIVLFLTALGYFDMIQTKHSIMRIYPVVGRLRFFMEEMRPKIYQYFIESDIDGRPINRIDRSTVYQRAKKENDTMPFGTQLDVYSEGYEWLAHSMAPKNFHKMGHNLRVMMGNKDCKQPYSSSILNISAMSFGSLSRNAVEAMNAGAKLGDFAHNTGEGGLSEYHLKHGGDVIWQIGTGYFGCRAADGGFDPVQFEERATLPNVKMIEIKISQGAKPGHGGILPASKNTPEIAAARNIQPYTLVESPPSHSAFSTPLELIEFIKKLRELSGGKPVGFKLCIGHKSEFIGICKAMIETNTYPDFITVDGAEGGTGAAPQEFSNYVGAPLLDGLAFVVNILNGMDIKKHIKVFASGKVTSGFHIIRALAIGADACYSARAMMMAVGCIQALQCNTNKCPVGVATQDPQLTVGLVVEDKKTRIANFHNNTVKSVVELLGATGLDEVHNLNRSHIYRRISFSSMQTYEEIFPSVEVGAFLDEANLPEKYKPDFKHASAEQWGFVNISKWGSKH